jgi:hypothetical protein
MKAKDRTQGIASSAIPVYKDEYVGSDNTISNSIDSLYFDYSKL